MWLILQSDKAEDWVIGTGVSTTVREFVIMAFKYVGVELEFIGEGLDEKGIVKSSSNASYSKLIGVEVVVVDKNYFRPTEVDTLVANPKKVKTKLGWEPKYNVQDIVNEMMKSDLDKLKD